MKAVYSEGVPPVPKGYEMSIVDGEPEFRQVVEGEICLNSAASIAMEVDSEYSGAWRILLHKQSATLFDM